jgi:DNA-directed RNA polymerase subunit omega
MITHLKTNEIVRKCGGRFKLTALVQHRWRELLEGARPLVERNGRSDLEVAIDEVMSDKITLDFEASGITPPKQALQ